MMRATRQTSRGARAALLLAGTALLLAAACCCCLAQDQQQQQQQQEREVAGRGELPKLFDFEHFKRLYGKTYGSLAETLARKRLFFSRALKAFVTGVKYKFRRMSHFLGVNHLSDWSDEELDQMRNRALETAHRRGDEAGNERPQREEQADAATEFPEFIPAPEENVEAEIVQLIEEHEREPGFEELARQMHSSAGRLGRAKRSLEAPAPPAPREFSLDELIASSEELANQLDRSPKLVRDVASNNPEYEPFELDSFGLRDTESTKWVTVRKKDPRPVYQQARSYLSSWLCTSSGARAPESGVGGVGGNGDNAAENHNAKDGMIVDLRDTQCMFMPRNQRRCGSCYAFAAISIMEFHYCMKTNKLVALSEQYMINCGKGRFWRRLDGCDGALAGGVTEFIHNFGMELGKHFPYLASEGKCPYEEDMDIKKTGYIRMPIAHVAQVHVSKWAEALPHGPLYVDVATGKDFSAYGGGVYDGRGCAYFKNHAMVLVGHGREDGQEFWLIRNSYGFSWGSRGHWKLAKSATRKCIWRQKGLAFGSKDGVNYDQVVPELVNKDT